MGRLFMRLRGSAPPSDTTPDAFSFTDVSGQTEGATVTGSAVTISGINASTAFTVTGGFVQINGTGSFVTSGSVVNGDTLTPRGDANATYLGTTDVVVTVGGVSDTFRITTRADPSAGALVVGPNAGWNGTADTGAGAPDGFGEARSGQRVIGGFLTRPYQRVSGPYFRVRIACDAFDGVASATLSGDVITTANTTKTLRERVDPNGATKIEEVFEFDIDIAACLAQNAATNTLNIYATLAATNAGVQRRVIGPLVVYPESTVATWSKTVSVTGFYPDGTTATDYSTIADAIAGAKTAGVGTTHQGGVITIVTDGFYTLVNSPGYTEPGRGYLVLTQAAGVSATLGRTSRSTTDNYTNQWVAGYNGMEFRGLTFDQRYFTHILFQNSSSRRPWFNACRFTNTCDPGAGATTARDTFEFNKGPHPGCGPQGNSSSSLPSYWDDCHLEYLPSPLQAQLSVVGQTVLGVHGDIYSNTPMVYQTYNKDLDSTYYRTARTAITVAWNGSPGAATIAFTSQAFKGICTIVDPSGTLAITCDNLDTGSGKVWTMTQLKAAIEAHDAGWAVTVDSDVVRAQYLYSNDISGATESGWPAYTVTSTPKQLYTYNGIHGDLWQGANGGTTENTMISRLVLRGDNNLSSGFNFDSAHLYDTAISHVSLEDNNIQWWITSAFQHVVVHHIFSKKGIQLASSLDAWTDVSNCIFGDLSMISGSWPATARICNNASLTTSYSNTGASSGNFQISSFASVFQDFAAGDYRPAGALLSNLKTPSAVYDARGLVFASPDAVGPNSNAGSAAAYPF